MAHPHKADAAKSSGSKFHRMTRDYGMAGGKDDYITTPGERLKSEVGSDIPENSVGFGAESSAATSRRGDRPARRAVAANPVATYARGGKVTTAASQDKSGIDNMSKLKGPAVTPHRAKGGKVFVHKAHSQDKLGLNVQSKMTGLPVRPHKETSGTGPEWNDKSGYTNEEKLPVPGRARGGGVHGKKGATHVNVIVAPQGGSGASPAGAGGPPPQLAALMAGAHPPAGGPPMGAPPPGGPPMLPPGAGPGGPPMPPMRKRGGKVSHMGGHPDASQDKELIHKTLREEGLVKKARGGGIHMTASAATGNGRLEKMGIKVPNHRDGMKPQAV